MINDGIRRLQEQAYAYAVRTKSVSPACFVNTCAISVILFSLSPLSK